MSDAGVTSAAIRHHAGLLRLFLRQDLRARFVGNLAGTLWAVVSPLAQLAIFHLVFTQIFKARVPGLEGVGYLAFLALGFWPWFAFSEAVTRAAGAIQEQAGLLDKVAVSPAVLVLARVAGAFVVHGIGFIAVLVVLSVLGIDLHWSGLGWVLLLWLPLLVFAIGLGLVAATVQVFVRDLAQMIGPLMSLLFFLTPIIYARSIVPDFLQGALDANPLTGLVEGIRAALIGLPWPPMAVTWLVPLATLALGAWMYRRTRARFEDFL